ncbi:MAG: TonB family protein [Sphingomonas fennica]
MPVEEIGAMRDRRVWTWMVVAIFVVFDPASGQMYSDDPAGERYDQPSTTDRPSSVLHPEPTGDMPPPIAETIPFACKDRPRRHQSLVGTTTDWITDADYPEAAAGAQGTVVTEVIPSATGRLSHCTVIRSSGHPALDRATCPLLMRRARLTQAIYADGCRPPAAIRTLRHTWRRPLSFRP